MIRVFIVAASPVARAGLQTLAATRDAQVVGSAPDLDSLADQWLEAEAEVILVYAPGEQLEEAIASLSESQLTSETAVVVTSDRSDLKLLAEALRTGIRAVLPGDLPAAQLAAAIGAAASGWIVMNPSDIGGLVAAAEPLSQDLAELAEPLTPREREVLQMLAGGFGNKQIAARLAISEHTVKFHVASILGKLGASSRTEAVALGIRRGLVLL